MKYTTQQQSVISERNKDILVCAGAGSGKTAVLIERIMGRLTDSESPVDIDRILVLTFTRAAASQMRERLLAKIREYCLVHPDDQRMQTQQILIGNAQITTIDSFCLFVLRNHFHITGIDPGFRIADEGEEKLIENEVLADVLEEMFKERNEDFLSLADIVSTGAGDGMLERYIMDLAEYASSHPDPQGWLQEMGDCSDVWPVVSARLLHRCIRAVKDCVETEKLLLKDTAAEGAPSSYGATFESDISMLERLLAELTGLEKEKCDPDAMYEGLQTVMKGVSFVRLATLSKAEKELVDTGIQDRLKNLRNRCKEEIGAVRMLTESDAESAKRDISLDTRLCRALSVAAARFLSCLLEEKKKRGVFSFSDIEHFALDILSDKGRPTEIAISYRDYFEEIMCDEYQDSNQIQEDILRSISRAGNGRHNRFMVGDRKQSIYRFRMARPGIFNDRLDEYSREGDDNRVIYLSSNFRSRPEVIDSVNRIFGAIMRRRIGNIEYDESEMLTAGREDEYDSMYKTELMLLTTDMNRRRAVKAQILMIVVRIRKMLAEFTVPDENTGKNRPLKFSDIAILARSVRDFAPEMKKALEEAGIPAHCQTKTGYYSEREIVMCMDLLRCIDNPYHDIPMVSTLRSLFFSFSDEDLAVIRSMKKDSSFYEALINASQSGEDRIRSKSQNALEVLCRLRKKAEYLTVSELIEEIYLEFGYRQKLLAMPYGQQRASNADMLLAKARDFCKTSYQGLFWFIRYMDQLNKYQVDEGEAGIVAESADVVRIMSVHGSKGLEYPVVFLADCGGRFNMSDANSRFLMDLEDGIACDSIDPKLRVQRTSLRKKLQQGRMINEGLGEELRLLYVACTRAREKLIMTGICSLDNESYLKRYEFLGAGNGRVPAFLLEKALNWQEYLLMAHACDDKCFDISIVSEEDIDEIRIQDKVMTDQRAVMIESLNESEKLRDELEDLQSTEGGLYRKYRDDFSYVYPFENLKKLYAKTSVSELKHAAMEEAGVMPGFETQKNFREYVPLFARKKQTGGTDRGSAFHRVMELLDIGKYTADAEAKEKDTVKELMADIEEMAGSGRLTREYADLVSPPKIAGFLGTESAAKMGVAMRNKKLFREQPFVISIDAGRLDSGIPEGETVMIQGVIDVFWEEDGKMMILDYKTDSVSAPEELVARYKTQMDYYGEAVERLTGRRVDKRILYSFCLDREIMC